MPLLRIGFVDITVPLLRPAHEPLLSIGNPTVTVQVGGRGEIYVGFQIPNS